MYDPIVFFAIGIFEVHSCHVYTEMSVKIAGKGDFRSLRACSKSENYKKD
jgi:hypothetical protein